MFGPYVHHMGVWNIIVDISGCGMRVLRGCGDWEYCAGSIAVSGCRQISRLVHDYSRLTSLLVDLPSTPSRLGLLPGKCELSVSLC